MPTVWDGLLVGAILGFVAGWGIVTHMERDAACRGDFCQRCRDRGAL
jgi:hypothetical protein